MNPSLRCSSLLLAFAASSLGAQVARPARVARPAPVVYDISFPYAIHREGEVTVRFSAVPAGALRVRMARSSPGRYALHEFAKNVYSVRASDGTGKPLAATRISPHEWSVSGHRGVVVFSYTLYADRADGTYAGIDDSRIHLNIPATFAWSPSMATRPITVTFHLPNPSWTIATQLQPTADPRTFRAPNLQYFMDSPTHIGAIDMREWRVTSGGRTQTLRLALDHLGTAQQLTEYTELTKRVVNEAAAVYGELPRFDYGTYTFVACYRPNCAGDGMEHRNSTSVTSGRSLAGAMMGLLGTVSHEFFHAWNVERIRPKTIEPFDFTEANMSGELWLAEGFTSYYGDLIIARAGIMTPSEYVSQLSGAVNALTNTPARHYDGAMGMSQQAPFVDAAVSIDPNNRANTFLSYYTYGEALGIALDLTLRARTPSVTLDDFMRAMWRNHGKVQTEALAPARPYTLADAEAALAAVTKDSVFAREFFARYVVGSALPDYATLLARAAVAVRQAQAGSAWMGDTRISAQNGEVLVAGPTADGTPMHEIGLSAGDQILTVGDATVSTMDGLLAALSSRKPGDQVRVTWRGRAGEKSATMTLRANPRVEVLTYEAAGLQPSPQQLAFRAAWLGSKQASAR